jgi:chemotaxis methyl-accepting protein methylase
VADVEAMMAARIGLRLDPSLRGRLERSLADEAAAAGLSLDHYSEALQLDTAVFQRLLDRITVQQTSFFRDPEIFATLATYVMPHLNEPVVAWSAGCSNGQEAYSLAMLLQESGLRDWTVLGTDISARALAKAQRGAYSEAEMAGVSPARRDVHMRRGQTGWEVLPALRGHVRFQHHNLSGTAVPLPVGSCQLILCRNVLIYFIPKELLRVLDRFATVIRRDGYLILGASESLWQLSERFRLNRIGDSFMYRLSSAEPTVERRHTQQPATTDRRRHPTVAHLLGQGEAAAASGDFAGAASAFRRATYMDPEHPVPYFQLALCLERSGQVDAARKALEAARAAIQRCDKSRFQADLDGFHVDELVIAIERRLGQAT